MKFEKFIKNTSAIVAAVVVFFMAGGFYLSVKGFVMNPDGSIVLMRPAMAQDTQSAPEIPDNMVLPEEHAIGSKDAPVTIYEYSSFGCFHCADFHLDTLPRLKKTFVDKGLARIVFVPFPIDKASMDAALLAECMPDDKYFAFVDLLFKKQREWGLARDPQKVLKQYAALSGLGAEKADACLRNDDNAREILSNRQTGITQLGIQGTPSFVIRRGGQSELLPGVQSFETFSSVINQKIAE